MSRGIEDMAMPICDDQSELEMTDWNFEEDEGGGGTRTCLCDVLGDAAERTGPADP